LAKAVTDEGPRYGEMRPAPRYGEYATPQDQAQAMRSKQPIAPGDAPSSQVGPAWGGPTGVESARPTPRRWDLILTAVILAYATLNVVSQLFLGSSLSTVIDDFYRLQGIGKYTPTSLAGALSIVLNGVTAVLYVLTVAFTVRQLRRGRVAFYIPIIGGVIATLVAVAFVIVLLTGDPTFTSYMNGRSG
jgi:uncharacterized protein (DUF697 family)